MVVVVVRRINVPMVILGAIVLCLAIVMAYIYVVPAVSTLTDSEYIYNSVEYTGLIYKPVSGTEDYVLLAGGNFSPVGTGIYRTMIIDVYGTLYVSDTGQWLIVDPSGQVPASGGFNAPLPEHLGESV